MEFMQRFPDDAACLEYLWRSRYSPDGVHATCPKCGVERVFKKYAMSNRNTSWTCTGCSWHVSATAGTIFHKSSTSLHLWFYAMYLMTSTRCGISAKQLERELGVTYKTAWRMFHLIRNQLMTQDDELELSGTVEADEMYVGGVRKGTKGGRPPATHKTKRPVFGMVERGGNVVAIHVENVRADTLIPQMQKRILPGSMIYTDEYPSYGRVARSGYQHRRIHHKTGVYVDGDVHTNTIEGFWSLVKRGIGGTHHAVSAKFLQGYLNEYVWRYNRRNDPEAMFDQLVARSTATLAD